jgi:hypothetical protein
MSSKTISIDYEMWEKLNYHPHLLCRSLLLSLNAQVTVYLFRLLLVVVVNVTDLVVVVVWGLIKTAANIAVRTMPIRRAASRERSIHGHEQHKPHGYLYQPTFNIQVERNTIYLLFFFFFCSLFFESRWKTLVFKTRSSFFYQHMFEIKWTISN